MKRFFAIAAIAAALGGFATVAHADDAGAIKYRKSVMDAIGGHMGAMGTILKGEGGKMEDFRVHAHALADLSQMVPHIFPQGSDKMGGDTKAKMKIWDEPAEFQKVVMTLQEKAKALAVAADTGDKGKIAEALGALGKNACKACHDSYKDK